MTAAAGLVQVMKEVKTEEKLPLVLEEYELQEKAGEGTFAVVFLAAHLPTGARVAVKEIDPKRVDERVRGDILQEMKILGSLSHPNILRLLDTIQVTPETSRTSAIIAIAIVIEFELVQLTIPHW